MERKTLIILDWDDTLFPTSWSIKNNIDLNDKNTQNKYIIFFAKLDMLLYKLFFNLQKYGKVVIVTNAVKKWVYLSLNMLPNTQRIIEKYIDIISARDLYQKKYPKNTHLWKKLIFKRIFIEYFISKNIIQNIISVGDAEYELNALINLYDIDNKIDKRYLKSIKFIETPTYDILIDQLEVLNNYLVPIINNKKHLDLRFDTLV